MMNTTIDPVEDAYQSIAMDIKKISWEDFENLTKSLVAELGFHSVHRLTRGSQHGKDIIGTWESRFVLGRRVQFRFQCKHKQGCGNITKKDIGDSISDFLLQNADEILVIVTNAQLSNDLIDQMDKASDSGVYAISQNQLIRLITSCPQTAGSFLGLTIDLCESTRQYFENRDWIETICNNKSSDDLKITLHRFWTEPYTWFFYEDTTGRVVREWTTFGGEFRLGCRNFSQEIQDFSGLSLHLLKREPLPKFAVVNTTPKGGQNLKRVEITLSKKLGSFDIGPDSQYLAPDEFYNCLVDFQPKDPGIYMFQIRLEGSGGSKRIRESEVFTIVALPKYFPRNYIDLHESWPQSFVIIEKLFQMSKEQRRKTFGLMGSNLILFKKESGELVIKYHSKLKPCPLVSDMKEISIDHPLADLICAYGNSATRGKYYHLLKFRNLLDEWFDCSEPRAPLHRAEVLCSNDSDIRHTHDALQKAHERAPWHPKLNAQYAVVYYRLGYRGFAQFHMGVAYTVTPANPIIAGMHFSLQKILNKQITQSTYLNLITDSLAKEGFLRLAALSDNGIIWFPRSYYEAANLAFPEKPELQDSWGNQSW